MSLVDRALTAVKDIIMFREELAHTRAEIVALAKGVEGLVEDIRQLEQRLARLEGFIEGAARKQLSKE